MHSVEEDKHGLTMEHFKRMEQSDTSANEWPC